MKRFWLVLYVVFILPNFSAASYLTGRVISIADGDTITILDSSKQQHKIRLYGIDCPESGQAFGKAAKKHTAKLTFRKTAEVKSYDTDRYGRTVGVVYINGFNVNQNLIEKGFAWQYRKYCKASFCDDWIKLEKQAKYSGVGLWADNDPIAPWQWRKGKRNSSYSATNKGVYNSSRGSYHGNKKSHIFHNSGCPHYNCKNCTIFLKNREAAISDGYRPCGMCKP